MRQDYSPRRRSLVLAAAAAACSFPAFSQASKPLRLVVPFPPGGAVDAAARLLADRLPALLGGRTVIVENRPGAGGNIAAQAVAQSAPDGDVLLVTANNHTINPFLYAKAGYSLDDFAPVAMFAGSGVALVANPKTNFETLADMLAAAKANPNSLSYGSGGNGHPANLATELLKSKAKVSIQHVPYKGSGPLMSDVVGGQIPLAMVSIAAAQPFATSGQLNVLAVTSKQRWPGLPNVPTVEEAGFPGFEYLGWVGLLAKRGTRQADLDLFERQILAIAASEDARSRMYKQGLLITPKGSAEFKQALAHEATINRELIGSMRLKLD